MLGGLEKKLTLDICVIVFVIYIETEILCVGPLTLEAKALNQSF